MRSTPAASRRASSPSRATARVAAEITLGAAVPGSRDVIFSATKPVVAGAIWVLIGEGKLDPAQRVAELIPEFATNGKDVITVEQVMLHTSGFPHVPFVPLDWDDRERRLARFADWRCNWEPGTRFEYHPTSADWVLAELIERVTVTTSVPSCASVCSIRSASTICRSACR